MIPEGTKVIFTPGLCSVKAGETGEVIGTRKMGGVQYIGVKVEGKPVPVWTTTTFLIFVGL